jgi:hypothetical protein
MDVDEAIDLARQLVAAVDEINASQKGDSR